MSQTGRIVVVAAVALGLVGVACLPSLPVGAGETIATARLHVSPSPAKFPSTPPPYWPMPIVKVTITNTGNATVKSIIVHPVSVYSVPSTTCTTLHPGQHCVARIQFCPTSPNHYVDTLTITGKNARTGSGVRARITLEGTAT